MKPNRKITTMKNLNTLLLALVCCTASTINLSAQPGASSPTEKTRRFLVRYIASFDTAQSDYVRGKIIKGTEMVAGTAKTDWISQYHAAYCNAITASRQSDTTVALTYLEKAKEYLRSADSLKKNESEIVLLSGMIKYIHSEMDTGLVKELSPQVVKDYEQAKKLNPENPRVYLMMGERLFKIPEQAGGGKKKAREMAMLALKKLEKDSHEDPAWPTWGKSRAETLLAKCDAK